MDAFRIKKLFLRPFSPWLLAREVASRLATDVCPRGLFSDTRLGLALALVSGGTANAAGESSGKAGPGNGMDEEAATEVAVSV